MKVPLSWLKEYVDITIPVKELAHRLTMAGVEVVSIETIGGWENCYVGEVLNVEPHPDADRLRLVTVDIGKETWKVVCGAPNVAAGQKICFAKVGARLFNTHTGRHEALKPAKIRGVVSEGMVCSEIELGIGEDHTGIVVLDDSAPVGMPLDDYLGDAVLDIETTPNRGDLLSVLGVAHEVAALTGATVREPDASYKAEGGPIEESVSVEIWDPDLCPRYTATLTRGIEIKPSPRWMQDRLIKAGQRPINNVVDVTNYVMLEYGQPLHAFDFDAIGGQKIIVRRARENERIMTLDGVERHLTPDVLVIADAEDAVAVGGVIGGANSEVSEITRSVLLESANFNPINNRRTSQAMKNRTEASLRFEKGLRPELAEIALRRATKLMQDLAGGVVCSGIADAFPGREQYVAPSVLLTASRLEKVLGVFIDMDRVRQVLASLGFRVESEGEASVRAFVPYWRSDINIADDLVEEVARIIGYDNLPTEMLSTRVPHYMPRELTEFRERVRDLLASCGLQEVITYSLTSRDSLLKAGVPEDGVVPLRVSNPMSVDLEYMRTSLRPNLLRTVAANIRRYEGPVRLFEVGRVYMPRKDDLPDERETAVLAIAGVRSPVSWTTRPQQVDFFDAKGIVEAVMRELRLDAGYDVASVSGYHPGRTASIRVGEVVVGTVGEVHPAVREAFGLEDVPVAMAEMDLVALHGALVHGREAYVALPKFPAAVRDLSILVRSDVPAATIQRAILGHKLVARVTLFDVYEGDQLPTGQRSLAFHVHFQAANRTLTADEVSAAMERIVSTLQKQFDATLRK